MGTLNKGRMCSQEHEDQTYQPESRYGLLMGLHKADAEEYRHLKDEAVRKKEEECGRPDSEGSMEEVIIENTHREKVLNAYT